MPEPGGLDETDRALLDRVAVAFGTVGDLIGACKLKAALGEAMTVPSRCFGSLSLCSASSTNPSRTKRWSAW